MLEVKFLDLYSQYLGMKEEIDSAINSVIRDSNFIGGKNVQEFEDNFAEYHQAKFCVGVGNGTDALEIALEALDLADGSEVLVPANSFIACSEAVSRSGLKVIFCDIDPDDFTINIDDARDRITKKTSAIMAVHLYGHPCDMNSLIELARTNDLKIVEDCAQAHGAEYFGRKVGNFGDIGTFSFYPGKNLGAYGDGGAIITNNEGLSIKCRMIANHGRIEKYNHQFEGRNSRLDAVQAAVLNVKLRHLDSWIEHRNSLAKRYIALLSECDNVKVPVIRKYARHAFHLFVIRTGKRAQMIEYLSKHNVETGIHYPISLPKLRAYSHLGMEDANFQANRIDDEVLSLPIGEHLGSNDIESICGLIKTCPAGPLN